MWLSIVIPAFNEEKRIHKILDSVLKYFKNKKDTYEILVVDDGSSDNTSGVVRSRIKSTPNLRLLSYGENRGKGYAVKYGMLRAKGDYRLFADADNSTPFEEIDKFIPLLENGDCDIAIGSRGLRESNVEISQSWLKSSLGKLGNRVVDAVLGLDISDTQCGFKCFTARSVDVLFPKQLQEKWSFDMELLFLAKKHGIKVREVPVRWINDANSKVKPLDYIKVFFQVFYIRVSHLLDK